MFSDFLYKGKCYGYSFELHRQVDAIQMSTYNICLYKDVDKNNTGCNLKTTELLDCALIGVCAVIRSNTVSMYAQGRFKSACILCCLISSAVSTVSNASDNGQQLWECTSWS